MIGNTIVGNGPDDYALLFASSVNSVGFRLLTNNAAQENVSLFDAGGGLIANVNIDALTEPNSRQFVGFASPVPIRSLQITTQNGAVQNEGIDLLEVGGDASATAPEPSALVLLGTGLVAAITRLRHRA
jgi:hypothetical protein